MPWDDGMDWGSTIHCTRTIPTPTGAAARRATAARRSIRTTRTRTGAVAPEVTAPTVAVTLAAAISKLLGWPRQRRIESILSSLGGALGLTNGSGAFDLAASLARGVARRRVNSINATSKASDQMKEAADKANQQARTRCNRRWRITSPTSRRGRTRSGRWRRLTRRRLARSSWRRGRSQSRGAIQQRARNLLGQPRERRRRCN